MARPGVSPIRVVPTPWREIVLLCRKCTKRIEGGFGGKQREPLKAVLRDHLRRTGRRREVRIVEIGCVGLCPKRGVTLARASRPGELLAVPRGTSPEEVLAAIERG